MKKLLLPNISKPTLLLIIFILSIGTVSLFLVDRNRVGGLNQIIGELNKQAKTLHQNISNLTKENKALKKEDAKVQLNTYNEVVEKYEVIKEKTASYKEKGVNVGPIEKELAKVIDLILGRKYSKADKSLTQLDKNLEKLYSSWLAANTPTVTTPSCTKVPTSGHCQLSISTNNGSFTVDIVALNLTSKTAVTVTANSNDCSNNCPTKSLSSYVQANGGFAGIHGTYFCPPDYSSCASQVNSYNYPVYNSNSKKWLNQSNLFWNGRAMMAFTSSSAVFYPQANTYTPLSGLKAAIVNYPGLVYNGSNIVNNYPLSSAQLTKGYRGGIGVKNSTVYLVIAQSASVKDFAAVMMALDVDHALNLDGGGSSALFYNGSYKVGPGRALPNAVVFK
jgi:regulator of replication initiation timing